MHKGSGEIEESFLLNDAFNVLVKAKEYHKLLVKYAAFIKTKEKKGEIEFDEDVYKKIEAVKYEVCVYLITSFLEEIINIVFCHHSAVILFSKQ